MFWNKTSPESRFTDDGHTALSLEKSLAQSLQQVQGDCGIALLDADKNIIWFNGLMQKLFSFSDPDDIGRNISHLIRSPKFQERFLAQFQGEFCVINDVVLNRTISAMVLPYGSEHWLAFAYDSSEQERTKTAAQEIIANLSHELRSPLTVIKGYLEILQSRSAPDTADSQTSQAIAHMDAQCDRMVKLVESTLFLSRLETSQIKEDELQEIDVGQLLSEVIADTEHLHPKLRIETEVCADRLHCIPSDIYSLISNLLTNAIKYSDAGSVIRIKWYCDSKRWCFDVIDQGIGIKPQLIPYLTERFYRVDKTRAGATGGSGLGLAIVKQILLRYNARLNILSTPGEGSSFSCSFPQERVISGKKASGEA